MHSKLWPNLFSSVDIYLLLKVKEKWVKCWLYSLSQFRTDFPMGKVKKVHSQLHIWCPIMLKLAILAPILSECAACWLWGSLYVATRFCQLVSCFVQIIILGFFFLG
jgi:hypothetical protein